MSSAFVDHGRSDVLAGEILPSHNTRSRPESRIARRLSDQLIAKPAPKSDIG